MVLAFVIASGFFATPTGAPSGTRAEALRERVMSYLVSPGATRERVEALLGVPFGVDSHGPPREFVVVYTYFFSGVSVTFGADGRAIAVKRGAMPTKSGP